MRSQNPFWRLKHYRVTSGGNDSRENHATESLAALLRWSPAARGAVIHFLSEGVHPSLLHGLKLKQIDIETQVAMPIGRVTCYLDLLIKQGTKPAGAAPGLTIGVEAKVTAAEDAKQLKKYSEWLKKNITPNAILCSLARSPDPTLNLSKCGVNKQHSWLGIYRCLAELQHKNQRISEAEKNLLATFCGYLEIEGIAMSYHVKDLQYCQKAVKATGALESIFGQVAQELKKDKGVTAKPKVALAPGETSCLEIGKESWKKKFRKTKHPRRIWLWFEHQNIRSDTESPFYATLHLYVKSWDRWNPMQPKLSRWYKSLDETWYVCQHDRNQSDNSPPNALTARTLQVAVDRTPPEKAFRSGRWLKLGEEELVSLVVRNAKKWISEIDSLP